MVCWSSIASTNPDNCKSNKYTVFTSTFLKKGNKPETKQIQALIVHLNGNQRHQTCLIDDSSFLLEAKLQKKIADKKQTILDHENKIKLNKENNSKLSEDIISDHKTAEAKVKEIKNSRKKIKDLENTNTNLQAEVTELTDYLVAPQKQTNKLSNTLTSLCLDDQGLVKSNTEECFNKLITQLKIEQGDLAKHLQDYKKIAIASALIEADILVLEAHLPKSVKLEDSPSRQEIIDQLLKDKKLNANASLVMDLLDQRSAQIALFKNKLTILQRNTNLALEIFKESPYYCSVPDEIEAEMSWTLYFDIDEKLEDIQGQLDEKAVKYDNATSGSESKESLKNQLVALNSDYKRVNTLKTINDNMSTSDKAFCESLKPLAKSIKTTLNKSYDDTWFQNKNLEREVDDISALLDELNTILNGSESNEVVKRAKRINFVQHSQKFFDKYNDTARFNVGVGVTIFNAPILTYSEDKSVHLAEILGPSATDSVLKITQQVPDAQKLTPNIVFTLPYLDLNLAFPNVNESYQTAAPIQQVQVTKTSGEPAVTETTNYLQKSTIDWKYKVDFDASINFKVLSFTRDLCQSYWCEVPKLFSNADIGIAWGRTHLELEHNLTSELREVTSTSMIFSELVASGTVTSAGKIDSTIEYKAVSFTYHVADQLKLDIYKKWYGKAPVNLDVDSNDDVWGVTFSYLYF